MLQLIELGLFVLALLGPIVERSKKRTQKEEIEADDDNHYSQRPEDEYVTVVAVHRLPCPLRLAGCSLAAP